MDPLEFARILLAANKGVIEAAVQTYDNEADQVRIPINIDILRLMDENETLAEWLLCNPLHLQILEQNIRSLLLQKHIDLPLPFNLFLRCSHVLPGPALLQGRVTELYSEGVASMVNYSICQRPPCLKRAIGAVQTCDWCGSDTRPDESTCVLVRTRDLVLLPDSAVFRHIVVRLQEELIDTVALGDHVRLFGHFTTDGSYKAYYARTTGKRDTAPGCSGTTCAQNEEYNLRQLVAVQQQIARMRAPYDSSDERLHNLRVALLLQALSLATPHPLHTAVITNDAQLILRIARHTADNKVVVLHNHQRQRLLPSFKITNAELKTWSLEAGMVNLTRNDILIIVSAEELSKKELFGVKQVVTKGATLLGKNDVQLSIKCPASVLAVFEEYADRPERLFEAIEPFDLVFDMRDLDVSVDEYLQEATATVPSAPIDSALSANEDAQTLIRSYFLANRRVRGSSIDRVDFPLHVMETLNKITLLSARLRGSAHNSTVSDALLAIELVEETLAVKYGTSLLGFKQRRRNILSYNAQLPAAYKEFSRHLQVFCEAHLGLMREE